MVPAFRLTIAALRSGNLTELSSAMPTTTEACIGHPTIGMLKHEGVIGLRTLKAFIEKEIIYLNAQMNVAHAMTSAQIIFTSDTIIECYPNESLADICLALKRGARGQYGSTFHQLDCVVVTGWIKQHIEEKAYYLERNATSEKAPQATLIDYKAFQDRLAKERAQTREQRIKTIVAKDEEQLFRDTSSWQPMTDAQVELRKEITMATAHRYKGMHGGQFNDFSNFEIDGQRIFAKSEGEAREILTEAKTKISLKPKPTQS
jgi:hypothetical protein